MTTPPMARWSSSWSDKRAESVERRADLGALFSPILEALFPPPLLTALFGDRKRPALVLDGDPCPDICFPLRRREARGARRFERIDEWVLRQHLGHHRQIVGLAEEVGPFLARAGARIHELILADS